MASTRSGRLTRAAGLASALARHADARVIAVDYRLAPENPYPAAIDDAAAAYRALLEHVPNSQLAITGESAGGGLAAALLLSLGKGEQEGLAQALGRIDALLVPAAT